MDDQSVALPTQQDTLLCRHQVAPSYLLGYPRNEKRETAEAETMASLWLLDRAEGDCNDLLHS